MSRIREGNLYLRVKRGQISIREFHDEYREMKQSEFNNLKPVSEIELGKHKGHEMAHGQVYKELDIDFKYYLSSDGEIAATIPNEKQYLEHVSKLSLPQFIDFLKKIHNPEGLDPENLTGTDHLVYQVLIGNFGEKEIETWVISSAQ